MVLNDVTNEFSTLIDLLSRGDATYTFIRAALDISFEYQNRLNSLIEFF